MRTLVFVIPARGRTQIAEVCLRQLRRTCDALARHRIVADGIVIAADENLEIAEANGFATVEHADTTIGHQLGRKINDGYQAAASAGADYMVAFGNDDWVDPAWIRLPGSEREIVCTRLSAVVNEDGTRLARLAITYPGGDGVRIYPRALLARSGFRPADEDRGRAIDTATHRALGRTNAPTYVYHDVHPLQIVDFKTRENLNDYAGCRYMFGHRQPESEPWDDLAAIYPAEAVAEMRAVYDRVPVIA